jgi:ATP-dependent helicase/nuclease subunit B
MSLADLDAALAAAATVVTPNNRLARHIAARHVRGQLAAGRSVWPTPRILPWQAWLASLWLDALAADAWAEPPALINATQALRLWGRAVERDLQRAGGELALVDPRGAAERAVDAWQAFHMYAERAETPAAFAAEDTDAAAFARWARHYAQACGELRATDIATLADRLADVAPRIVASQPLRIALAAFVELTPQQARLVAALRDAGADVRSVDTASGNAARRRAEFVTPRDEMVAALQWARARVAADPAATATIAVVDLRERAESIGLLADEILRPQALAAARIDGARPWNLTLAPPLAAHPLVVPALDLIALAQAPLPLARAAALARSPHFRGGTAAAAQRAAAEGSWRNLNMSEISLGAFIAALGDGDPLRDGLATLRDRLHDGSARSPHAWADTFAAALADAGWPGDDTLSSELYQADEALRRALGEWRSLALVDARMGFAEALASLRAHCTRTTFQPQAGPARVEIMGILEAAGQDFDGLWLAGMDVDAWPPRAVPRPFLPAWWQRARGVIGATPESALARAERLTAQLAGAAREAIASHSTTAERPPRRVSPLVAWPLASQPAAPTPTMIALAAAPALERVDDARLPALPAGSTIRGGVRLVEAVSECPFRAAAMFRLAAQPWPRVTLGLSPFERGRLMHAALAELWGKLDGSAALDALDDAALRDVIDDAVAHARSEIPDSRWRRLPPLVVQVEAARLARALETFLRDHEAERPPFRVVERESNVVLRLGGLVSTLRIDRIDAIGDGLAVIDYKTGDLPSLGTLLLPRPVAPQTGLYALALEERPAARPVSAVALMSLKSGKMKTAGIAAAPGAWRGMKTPAEASRGRLRDFAALAAFWRDTFGALATQFREGDAAVAPREHPRPCARCDFKPLCRVDALAFDDEAEPDDGADA